MGNKVVSIGDKIDIFYHHDNDDMSKHNNKCVSMLSDLKNELLWEVTMPVSEGRMILFEVGAKCDFTIYTSNNTIFNCLAIVRKRYKRGNLFYLAVEIVSELKKIQRRDYFRVECCIDFHFTKVEDDNVEQNIDKLYESIELSGVDGTIYNGVILDISGGGIKFSSGSPSEEGKYILSVFKLDNEDKHDKIYVICKIITCEKNEMVNDKYINRAQFIFKTIADREKVVHYVFEEERKKRHKMNG